MLVILIKIYQYSLSPLLGPCCRFYPSCSNYALESITKKRLTQAIPLIIKRLYRCHPNNPGGLDPVDK